MTYEKLGILVLTFLVVALIYLPEEQEKEAIIKLGFIVLLPVTMQTMECHIPCRKDCAEERNAAGGIGGIARSQKIQYEN